VTWLLDHHEVHLMLQSNPDGRKQAETGLLWRKNVNNDYCSNSDSRGADLNRNFDFEWSLRPSSRSTTDRFLSTASNQAIRPLGRPRCFRPRRPATGFAVD
jgi:hypothetical protein